MDLASGYSDSSANPFGYVNNAVAQNQANMLANYNANLAYVGGQNQAALNNNFNNFGQQTDYYSGLGAAYPTFGDPAAPGTYSPGSGLSSFSGTSLGGGMTYDQYGNVTGYTGGGGQPAASPYDSSGGVNTYGYPGSGSIGQNQNAFSFAGGGGYPMGSAFDPYSGGGFNTGGYPASGLVGPQSNAFSFAGGGSYGGGINYDQYGNVTSYGVPTQAPNMQSTLGYTPDQYLNGPNYGGAGQFDPNSFANRFAAGGYYNPGTPSQISGYAPNGYNPLSGQQAPYTYQPGFVQGMGGPGDWVPQQIPGMNTLSPNDMQYQQSYNGM